MDDDVFTTFTEANRAMSDLGGAIDSIRHQLEWVAMRREVDPDGLLSEISAVHRLKRGCRR